MMIVINTINTSLEHIQQCLAALGAYVDVCTILCIIVAPVSGSALNFI